MLRKLFRPLKSQGSTTSVWPTFSMRTARFDCQLCSMAPSRFIPQPIGDRQLVPSIVPPCTTMYRCSPVVMFVTWLLATSPGRAFESQGSSAVATPDAVKRAANKVARNMGGSPREPARLLESGVRSCPAAEEKQELAQRVHGPRPAARGGAAHSLGRTRR